MKAFGAMIFVALAAVVAAGDNLIPNHPICVPINNEFYHSFADPDDCTCFYKCDWANAVRFCCPKDNESDGNLVFNPDLQVCDRKAAAEAAGAQCSDAGTSPTDPAVSPPTCHPPTKPTEGPATPTEGPATPTEPASGDGCAHRVAECPIDNSFYHSYPHSICDNKWCQCDWGKAIVQPCPRDHAPKNYLVFNEVLQVCDYQKDGVVYKLCNN